MPLRRGMVRLRRLSRRASMTQPRSSNRAKAIRRLARQHARIADVRRTFLHEVSSQLVQTHDRLCLEDLAVANLMTNRRLARAIGDAAWSELARQLTYKAAWFGVELVVCDRWFASTKTCSCLAAWAERSHAKAPDRRAGGRVIKALEGKALTVALVTVEPAPAKGEPTSTPAWREPRHPRRALSNHPH
jgi:putative transposase